MEFDRNSNMPLYMQFKNILQKKIRTGELKPGSVIKTELELCKEFGISRHPVRKAMDELVSEGYLERTRGKGTFVKDQLPDRRNTAPKILGLILNSLTVGFNAQILTGFEKQARKRGYLTLAASSEGLSETEMDCLDRMSDNGVAGILVFPCDNSKIESKIKDLDVKDIYIGLIDRNPGIKDIDYIGSDNLGGAYSAVRHLALQGFRNVAFMSDISNVSSVDERLNGYKKAVEDFDLKDAAHISIDQNISRLYPEICKYDIEQISNEICRLENSLPLGIFAVNDFVAVKCMEVCINKGLVIGKDVGIVGFDNIPEGCYQKVTLTTVAQNGLLLGQNAADMAIDRIEGKSSLVHKSIIPTQLIVRSSCGEKL